MEDICRQQSCHYSRRNSFKYIDMCHFTPNLLTSYQEELNLQHCQHPHYGGRDHNGVHRSHPAGLQQRSTLPRKNWTSEMCMLHFYKLQKTSHKNSRSWVDSSELLHIAEDSYTTADISRPTGKQPFAKHKILIRLWLAVWRLCNRFLMHKKWRTWWKNKSLQPAVLSRHCIHL